MPLKSWTLVPSVFQAPEDIFRVLHSHYPFRLIYATFCLTIYSFVPQCYLNTTWSCSCARCGRNYWPGLQSEFPCPWPGSSLSTPFPPLWMSVWLHESDLSETPPAQPVRFMNSLSVPCLLLNPHPHSHPASHVSLILCSHWAASLGAQASLCPGHLLPLLRLKLLQSFKASHLGAFLCSLGRSLSSRGCSTEASSVCACISWTNRKTWLKTVHLPDGGSNLPCDAWNLKSESVWKNLKIQFLVRRLVVGSQRQLCFKCFIKKINKTGLALFYSLKFIASSISG